MGRELHELLDAPCIFCGYNGQGYYQAHTHDQNCPFYEIGGADERKHAFVVWGKKRMLQVKGHIEWVEEYNELLNVAPARAER